MIKLTQKEAIKFHEWLSDHMVSNHKWEILDLLDRIIGRCPNEKKKKVMNARQGQTGGGD